MQTRRSLILWPRREVPRMSMQSTLLSIRDHGANNWQEDPRLTSSFNPHSRPHKISNRLILRETEAQIANR